MKKKVTLKDIAEALNLSRNTVSKVINGYSNVPDSTREKVLAKAIEMNYKRIPYSLTEQKKSTSAVEIILITKASSANVSFWTFVLQGIVKQSSQEGFETKLAVLTQNEIDAVTLPAGISNRTAGFICLEIFPDNYIQKLESTQLPCVFIDVPLYLWRRGMKSDLVCMENFCSMYHLVSHLIQKGHSEIGFVGNYKFGLNYYERYMGYFHAMKDAGLSIQENQCIFEEGTGSVINSAHPQEALLANGDSISANLSGGFSFTMDNEWFAKQLNRIPRMPTAFVCASDHLAIKLIPVLKLRGYRIPEDIAVTGFGDVPETTIIEPNLTTVHTPKDALGSRAVEQLIWRISHRDAPLETIHLRTELKERASS